MHKVYINISGKNYRMEANWNATAAYCARKGVVNLTDIDHVSKITVPDILPLAHSCIAEGERLDGKNLELTEEELGAIMCPATMGEFIRKYAEMTTMNLPRKANSDAESSKKKS